MELEDQVCSLELSKRLKELGVNKESLFVWISIIKTGFDFIKLRESFEPDSEVVGAYNYPAYTVSELGEMLPNFIEIERDCYSDDEKYLWRIKSCDNEIFNENETHARAKMLIYLLEKKIMELT